ncbi:putative B3 domain-containing protein At5g35780 [Corylus avellana]|uniref:putative B3 domain-containing protein At5g35780 n=1 Tax=Corylus avellana TaxID=13451 RepID=UPI00286BC76A|nr:putative B3 domain-containing protein At5g35780 [Corylus avellana]XP_059448699.1 putative B3 domain-containing protein At5g35780 [Corylus avellana]
MAITLEDLRGDSPAICEGFNKIKEEVIRAVGEDQNKVDRLLTQRILMGLNKFYKKKRKQQYLEKLPLEKKSLEFDLHSLSLNWKLKRQRNKPLEKKPLELATKNSGNINKNQEKQEEEEEEEEEEEKSRKSKKQRKNPTKIKQEVPDRPPCMPAEFKEKIMGLQGSDIKFVIQKKLTITDMKASQNRLSVPRDPKRDDFLRSEEQLSLQEKEADGIHFKGKKVQLIEPGLQLSTIILKKWKLGSRNCYVLSNTWMDVAKRNRLKPGNTIQLWSLRVNQELHLALIKLDN